MECSKIGKLLIFLSLTCGWCMTAEVRKRTSIITTGSGADVDVPKCIENFDIHKDKIIRTTDSRAMGAKYLNEVDLDSRDECLRLCCETENCDVFVYEEKNAGSCYLFQCGPPEDFKCKFTHHVNYTSAINRHLLDLESQIKLTKHEQELTKLRKPEVAAGNVEIVPLPPTTRSTTTTSKPTTVVAKLANEQTETPTKTPNKKCSPYQFECRSTGECIAIYNACDGIPQCADGSDEGPELQCPDSTTPLSQNVQQPQASQEMQAQRLPPIGIGGIGLSQSANSDMFRQRAMGKPQEETVGVVNGGGGGNMNGVPASVNRQPDFLRPVADPLNPLHGPQYDPQQLGQYPYLMPQTGQASWGHLQQQNLGGQHVGQYPNKNSHIFNHKENGLQVPDIAESSQMQYANDVRDGQRLPNYYGGDVYGQQMPQIPILENNWPNNNNQPDFRQNVYSNQDVSNGRETWNQNFQGSMKNDANKLIYTKPAMKELPQIIETKEIGKHEQEKIANDLKNSKQHFANQDITQSSTTIPATHSEEHFPNDGHNHEHDHEHSHENHGKYITEYKITSEALKAIEDGISETPSGAVLSLTLGLILTAMMGILIGCRLRVVRRRLRRGGKSYAHDADYLVNGMYL